MIQGSREKLAELASRLRPKASDSRAPTSGEEGRMLGRSDARKKARRLDKILEEYSDAETIPYREVVKAVGPEIAAAGTDPFLDMTEAELVETVEADPRFKDYTPAEKEHLLSLLRPKLRKR